MAVFNIHKISTDIPGNFRSFNVILDKLLDLGVRPDLGIALDFELLVEERMPIGDVRFEAKLIVWLAESPRVCELETDY